ncbi:hypothetical protein BU24DRAFT_433102 [Aaosphaeria arxii CBS 175.79]|uniref:RING-type E3 ubiquitin transferase n=1 Tax=Aaosphaeria arxii CBS 175.79 TaxID=1450172 RepID=A0A6A5XR73_9PLEO|nr:uncharacterized protein BU24DRAFT_433102 [Aaosphaeria arxii CBS 175.79]KAF2015682.1 hypothetical protein BU24DRAFT_433102 [Aaosphaeria arxii CBS 175.79]
MASATDEGASHDSQAGPTSPPRRGGPGRGRGRGASRGPRTAEDQQEFPGSRGRGRGTNRGGGRGRGDRGGRGAERSSGKAPAADAEPAAPKLEAPAAAEDPDAEVCFICASPVQHTAVSPCNHRTCHICSLRLRALYKTKTCAHCRTESDHVIFTDDVVKNYEDYGAKDFFKSDDNLGIRFETTETYEDTVLLLRYNCPDADCDVACLGWPDLHRHVKTAHGKSMCDLCTRNKKVFTHEHELFTPAELGRHRKFGDDNPGAIDQSGFKGHPECGFCKERFYGDDELYTHCRDKHERCHICDRRDGGRKQQYYVDYNGLEAHFRKDHFLCPDTECLEKKFVVFDSEMDLKAHQIEVHPNGLSKDALRDARRVDMSGFQYRAPHEQERGGRRGRGREGGGRGRGRDPNAEPLPASSAQPLTRAELAYQRQMAIQSAPTATSRSFGGQLTSTPTPSEAFTARAPPNTAEPATVTASRPPAPSNGVSNTTNATNTPAAANIPRTPAEHARQLRHNAVIERAAGLLRNDQSKLGEFRNQVTAYRTSKVTATQLIDGFFSLFDTSSAELGKLVKELADIFEIPGKKDNLLKSWNDWRAINEDYPSLPGAASGLSLGGSAAHGGSRVLKLKSSTAQSSRSSVNKQASWSSSSSSNPFPALPTAASLSRIGAKPGQTPWSSSSASGSAPAARISPLPSRTSSSVALNNATKKAPARSADAFPALPAAPKPTSTIFSPGYTGAGLRRDNSGRNTPVNAWAGGAAGQSSAALPDDDAAAGLPGAKKKGNKNKKQTLFHFG